MLNVDNDSIMAQHNLFMQTLKNSNTGALLQRDFFLEIFPKLANKVNYSYPVTIGIPKSIQKMVDGDFEPKYTITVNGPIQGIDGPNWFGSSLKGITLHGCGYVNGDKRYICNQELNDKDIHMILAGATGQGKSVTLNSIILTLCAEYPPWELQLTMCDAKIVEFKTYAKMIPMPHIRSVAATGDADYLISVLSSLHQEMQLMNTVLTLFGAKNIESLRSRRDPQFNRYNKEGKLEYFLALPQNLIVIDEFQTMFKMAQKRTKEITDILDGFARLGRNTGYHLLLASQELGSDIPKAMLSNIKVRAAMGCFANVSTAILGNDAATANYGKKGALIINTEPSSDNNKSKNVNYRVPFAPDFDGNNQLLDIGTSIVNLGKKYGYQSILSFYDEQQHLYQKDYEKYLRSFKIDINRILLGEPSFVMNDPEQVIKLEMTGKDIENICVFTGTNINLQRYFFMLKTNIELAIEKTKGTKKEVKNFVICGDVMYADECHADKIAYNSKMYFDNKSFETNKGFDLAKSLIYRRQLILEADKRCKEMQQTNATSDKIFDSLNLPEKFDTAINRSRCYYMYSLFVNDPTVKLNFGITGKLTEDILAKRLKSAFIMYESYDLLDVYAKYDDFPKIYFWVLGLNKIQGLGRDTKAKNVESLKRMCMDCSSVNIRFILFTTSFEDITGINAGIRWYICESIATSAQAKIKVGEDYPTQIGGGLAVLFDPNLSENRCVKFKKIFLDGELPPAS